MATQLMVPKKIARGKRAEGGFSLVEVMISMAILTTGLVSLLADESYESIITARNTTQIDFDDIQNQGSTNCPITGAATCGIFLANMQPIYNAGADGIYGTSDDAAAGEQTLQDPGPDGVFLTADDLFIPLTGFQRQIAITAVDDQNGDVIPTIREVTITVQYVNPQTRVPQTYSLNSYISQFE